MFLSLATSLALAQGTTPSLTEVTVYNQGFGFIKEVRQFNLRQGPQQVTVENVASLIEPNSVSIRSLTDAGSFEVLEQNYQFDLISPLAILNKAVGSNVRFIRVLPNGAKETLSGTLISSPTAVVGGQDGGQTFNGMVIRTDDGRIVLNPTGEIEVSSLPAGLISKPTLLWEIDAARAGANNVELSYLTQGMSWKSDYVLTLDGLGTADFRGWVTMTNNSGATFEGAKLKLLAGDVQRAQPPRAAGRGGVEMMAESRMDKGFQEEGLFEYHLYTLQRPTTLRNKEMKQISLLEGHGLKVTKKLILDSMMGFGTYYPSEGAVGTGTIKPQVRVEFKNSVEDGLGMPLPMGSVKVYQRDKSGSVQMLGEDNIEHTPKDESVSLVVGRSFDVVGERKRTNFQRLSSNAFRETFEIEVRNRKDTSETVHLLERHYGDWRVSEKNAEFIKLDSNTMQFVLLLKAGESKKVIYTVETRW